MAATEMNQKIVIVEDESDLRESVAYNLGKRGFHVFEAASRETGWQLIEHQCPALLILDLMLPGSDGAELLRQLRNDQRFSQISVIIVSAKTAEEDIVRCFTLGADDYLTKPFSMRELILRVGTILHRRQGPGELPTGDELSFGDLTVNPVRHEVDVAHQPVYLTATEFRMLLFLAKHPGKVFSREDLIDHCIGKDVHVLERNIDVHIRALRKKLGHTGDYIKTVRGVGYRFAVPDSSER